MVSFDRCSTRVTRLQHTFDEDRELEGHLEVLTPFIPAIQEERKCAFLAEMVDEYRKLRPRIDGYDVWEGDFLVIGLKKSD